MPRIIINDIIIDKVINTKLKFNLFKVKFNFFSFVIKIKNIKNKNKLDEKQNLIINDQLTF